MYATSITDCFTKLKTIFQNGNTPRNIVRVEYKHPTTTAMGCTKKGCRNFDNLFIYCIAGYSFTQRTIMPLAVENFRSLRRLLSAGACLLNQKAKTLPSAVQL